MKARNSRQALAAKRRSTANLDPISQLRPGARRQNRLDSRRAAARHEKSSAKAPTAIGLVWQLRDIRRDLPRPLALQRLGS